MCKFFVWTFSFLLCTYLRVELLGNVRFISKVSALFYIPLAAIVWAFSTTSPVMYSHHLVLNSFSYMTREVKRKHQICILGTRAHY